jgi:hypothetical protein
VGLELTTLFLLKAVLSAVSGGARDSCAPGGS